MPVLKNQIPGGLADGKDLSKYDPEELLKGLLIELEHTNDLPQAVEITTDHLEEDPKYNTHLMEMEEKFSSLPKPLAKLSSSAWRRIAESMGEEYSPETLMNPDDLGSYIVDEILSEAPPELVVPVLQRYFPNFQNGDDLREAISALSVDETIDLLDDLVDV